MFSYLPDIYRYCRYKDCFVSMMMWVASCLAVIYSEVEQKLRLHTNRN